MLEPGLAAGDDLVDVRLVAGVPEDHVGRRVEHPVEGEGELDRTEVRAEVAGVVGHRGDDEVTDLAGEFVELRIGEIAEIGGLTDTLQIHAVVTLSGGYVAQHDQRLPSSMLDNSPFDLTGKVALVTGGNSGIGLGMAEGLASHGADIAIWGTNPDKNDAAVDQLGRYDVEVLSIVCDVSDEAAVVAAMADTVTELGRIDAVFVNAGVSSRSSSFVDMAADDWRRVMAVNLDGAFFTAREAVRHMVARHESGDEAGGSIVFTTSGSAFYGQQSGRTTAPRRPV